MRLIDADALIKEYCDGCEFGRDGVCDCEPCGKVCWVSEAPTIDPESLRQTGEWEDEYGGQFENPRYRCSVFQEKAFFKLDRDCLGGWHKVQALTPYCPICGARLKGAGKDAAD